MFCPDFYDIVHPIPTFFDRSTLVPLCFSDAPLRASFLKTLVQCFRSNSHTISISSCHHSRVNTLSALLNFLIVAILAIYA